MTLRPALAPRPYWQSADGRATLYLGDCLEVRDAVSIGVDALVSDVPYGIGYQHGGGGNSPQGRATHRRLGDAIHGDAAPFDPSPWLSAGLRHVALFGANHYARRLPDGGTMHVWDKTSGGQGPDDSFSDVEFLWVNVPGASAILHYLWKGVCQAGEKGERRHHPTQKPIAAMEWAMERARVPAGATVLDPYMGSGTTGVACVRTGRRFVGVEIDERYAETAARRIEAAMREQDAREAAPLFETAGVPLPSLFEAAP